MSEKTEHTKGWQRFTNTLAETEVPLDFLSPVDREQGIQVRDPLDAAYAQLPTPDERAGMDWWNGLKEADRRYWCLAGMTAVPIEAWRYYKLVTAPGKPERVCQIE